MSDVKPPLAAFRGWRLGWRDPGNDILTWLTLTLITWHYFPTIYKFRTINFLVDKSQTPQQPKDMRRSSSEMWNADVEAESSNEVADDMVVKVSDTHQLYMLTAWWHFKMSEISAASARFTNLDSSTQTEKPPPQPRHRDKRQSVGFNLSTLEVTLEDVTEIPEDGGHGGAAPLLESGSAEEGGGRGRASILSVFSQVANNSQRWKSHHQKTFFPSEQCNFQAQYFQQVEWHPV